MVGSLAASNSGIPLCWPHRIAGGRGSARGFIILHRLTETLVSWIDRWIPPALRERRTEHLRARVLVVVPMFATSVSLPVQAIRLSQESQHWIALLSWAICTLLFISVPIMLRVTGRLALTSVLVSVALLVGSLGVAVTEGGMGSPNTMVMILGPVVATLLGGRNSGGAVAVLVLLCSLGLWELHHAGLISSLSPLQQDTLTTMRVTMVGALSLALYMLTLFYEGERNRSERELSDKALELERARDAVVETSGMKIALLASQRRELERDRELAAAVQKLLLPKRDSMETEHVSVAGFSVPAMQAGGDWWFAETLPDGTLRVLLGDVTGHGAAPAMVAAVVAGAFRAMQETVRLDARAVLGVLHKVLLDVSAGLYTMPFGILEVTPSGRGTWLSAAASPVLILRTNGDVDTVSAPGTALGSDVLKLGQSSFELRRGERILLTSDGVPELRMSAGHDFGLRRLAKMLQCTQTSSVCAARDSLIDELNAARGDAELSDDLTFALIELRATRALLARC